MGVQLGVKVNVGGRKGVQEGSGVTLLVGVKGRVGFTITVAVWRLGGKVGPVVRLGKAQGVRVAEAVPVTNGVLVIVGVGVGFSGVRVHANQPMQ